MDGDDRWQYFKLASRRELATVFRYGAFMAPVDHFLLIASSLILVSVISSKIADRFGVPSLVLFLGVGMLAGSEGIGGIDFTDVHAAQAVGVTALAYILFAGGLHTSRRIIKPVLWRAVSLSTIGVVLTAMMVACFVKYAFHMTWLEGLLLGSIISPTDAAAVFSLLRGHEASFQQNIGSLLEVESGSNDPMSAFLTVGVLNFILRSDYSAHAFLFYFAQQLGLGVVLGYAAGRMLQWCLTYLNLMQKQLFFVLTCAAVPFIYSSVSIVGGSGFLAVYVAALALDDERFVAHKRLLRFHDNFAWLMQTAMFVVLGLLSFPSHVWKISGMGLYLALFLMLVGRPLSVFLALAFWKMPFKEKVLVAWFGLRGAVPIVFATYPLIAGIQESRLIFNLVFFVVLASVLFQGTSMRFVARWLTTDMRLAE